MRNAAILLALLACNKNGPTLDPDCGVGARLCGDKGFYDYDGDGYCEDVDCDEDSCEIYPGAPERCDGIDNDCDGLKDGVDPNLVVVDASETVVYRIDRDFDGACGEATYPVCVNVVNVLDNDQVFSDNIGEFSYCFYLTADEWDDLSAAEYDHLFDCCDLGTEEACIEDVPPRCIYPTGSGCYEDQSCH